MTIASISRPGTRARRLASPTIRAGASLTDGSLAMSRAIERSRSRTSPAKSRTIPSRSPPLRNRRSPRRIMFEHGTSAATAATVAADAASGSSQPIVSSQLRSLRQVSQVAGGKNSLFPKDSV